MNEEEPKDGSTEEDEPADEESAGHALLRDPVRIGGAVALFVGVGLSATGLADPWPLIGWMLGGLGVALAIFGHPPRLEPGPAPKRASGSARKEVANGPRRALAIGSAGVTAIGVAMVVASAFEHEVATGLRWHVVVLGVVGLLGAAFWTAVDTPPPHESHVRVPPPATERRRLAAAIGLAVVFLIEAAIPLRYYLGDDRFDERFAWRMFSAVRVYRCDLSAVDLDDGVESPVALGRTIHVAWVNTMRRGREGVMDRYLSWRCAETEIDGARLVNRCVTPEGETVDPLVREIECESGVIDGGESE